jgi:hypothetical protein
MRPMRWIDCCVGTVCLPQVIPPFEGVPADEAPCRAPCADFDFRRLGNRLTSLLISPWVSKGNAIQEPKGPTSTSQFELSSVPATGKTLFNLTCECDHLDLLTAAVHYMSMSDASLVVRVTTACVLSLTTGCVAFSDD